MLVNLACDWGRPSRNWPCAWTPSDYYRFLLSVSRNSFLSTDLQSAFWKRFGKEPSLGFPMDLTNLHAFLNDQKAGSRSELTSHQLAFRPPHTRHQHLTDGLGGFRGDFLSQRVRATPRSIRRVQQRNSAASLSPAPPLGSVIGIGGAVTCSPLPHHRTGGSAYGGSAS